MSLVKANTYQDASGGNTATINGMTPTALSLQGFRNRIINGDMRIDQRNAGASITPTQAAYAVDRWVYNFNPTGRFTLQQNLGSVTPPTGFSNYLGVSVSSAATPGSTDVNLLRQRIEGFNIADLAWGTASASTVTLSFWVRSSLTGTFSGAIQNGAENRTYPFTFTISAANTWEYKTVTISGDTTGTWSTNNSSGLVLTFNLGSGSSQLTTAGAWAASGATGATGQVNICATNGATFYITGVQLEAGTNATNFERVEYGAMLRACQRYYQQFAATASGFYMIGVGNVVSSTQGYVAGWLKTTMRSTPSFSYSGTLGTDIKYSISGDANPTGVSSDQMNPDGYALVVTFTGATGGQALRLFSLTTSGQMKFSAEL